MKNKEISFYFEQFIRNKWVIKGNIPDLEDGYEIRLVFKPTLW